MIKIDMNNLMYNTTVTDYMQEKKLDLIIEI